ncbi:hypothetical protein IT412_03635 [Candidatus Peregrinibacteria bacterium]|nr:hypothetical protein [Candidatus Peregrinibacteria bacterium]
MNGSRNNPPDLSEQEAIIVAAPIVHDNGEYHQSTRDGAQAAMAGQLEGRMHDVRWANQQISGLLEVLRDSVHREAIDHNLRNREIIIGVSELYKLFRDILERFRAIFRHLAPLAIDTETNAPVFSIDNTTSVMNFLSHAKKELPIPHPKVSAPPSGDFNLTPNQELIDLFARIVEDMDILKNPQYLGKIFKIVNEYLVVVMNTTDWALQWTMQSTAEQVSSLDGAAKNFHQQAESSELYDLQVDPETLILWESFLYEIELVFGEALVNVFDILGSNVSWLMQELDVDDLRRVLRECHRDLKSLQERKQAKSEWTERRQLEEGRRFASILNIFTQADPEDKTSFSALNQQINGVSTIITRLESTIAGKSKFPPRP